MAWFLHIVSILMLELIPEHVMLLASYPNTLTDSKLYQFFIERGLK